MNVLKFLGLMKENGDTQDTLATALGISRVTLNRKIHSRNGSSFTQPEIAAIRARYSLTAQQVDTVFFDH